MSYFEPPHDTGPARTKPPFCGDTLEHPDGRPRKCDLYRGHFGPHKSKDGARWETQGSEQ